MEILILEDERRVANQLKKIIKIILNKRNPTIYLFSELDDALIFINKNPIDLLLLDLNLNGEDGFKILEKLSAESFETIITSAYKEKAIDAFEYGVLDFVPKPYKIERIQKAILRLGDISNSPVYAKYLVVKKSLFNRVIHVDDVYYLQAQGHNTLIGLEMNEKELHHKSISRLLKILPTNFERIHKSFVVNKNQIEQFNTYEGSRYELILKNGVNIPVGRVYHDNFKTLFE